MHITPRMTGMTVLVAIACLTPATAPSTHPTAAAPMRISLSTSRHPTVAPRDLQQLFDDGAALLKSDDDGGGADDVSIDIVFKISDATTATFPDQSTAAVADEERFDYTLPIYNLIRNDVVLVQLLNASFADVKQIAWGFDFTGAAWPGSKPARMVLTMGAVDSTTVHELGHCAGLDDRYDWNRNIMYFARSGVRNEINTGQRDALQNY